MYVDRSRSGRWAQTGSSSSLGLGHTSENIMHGVVVSTDLVGRGLASREGGDVAGADGEEKHDVSEVLHSDCDIIK